MFWENVNSISFLEFLLMFINLLWLDSMMVYVGYVLNTSFLVANTS